VLNSEYRGSKTPSFSSAINKMGRLNRMKKLYQLLAVTSAVTVLAFSQGQLVAQDNNGGNGGGRPNRGNFDPEQMRQRQMERLREQLDVKSDDEWKAISDRASKIMQARMELGGGMGGFGGGRQRRGPDGGAGGDQQQRPRFGGNTGPEGEALQKAIESNASADEIKTKLAAYRDARKAKEAKLHDAQEDLRKILTAKQEAAAVLAGLLQ
jgi:hypothetical protein